MQKLCKKCSTIKNLDEFSKSVRKKDGRCTVCKVCHHVEYQQKRDKFLKYAKEYNKTKQNEFDATYIINRLLAGARSRAREKNIPFDITFEDIIIPSHCPVLNIPLQIGKRTNNGNSPTLDRIIPELGYVRGNVCVMSLKANMIKSSATFEEILKVGEWLKIQSNEVQKLRMIQITTAFNDEMELLKKSSTEFLDTLFGRGIALTWMMESIGLGRETLKLALSGMFLSDETVERVSKFMKTCDIDQIPQSAYRDYRMLAGGEHGREVQATNKLLETDTGLGQSST